MNLEERNRLPSKELVWSSPTRALISMHKTLIYCVIDIVRTTTEEVQAWSELHHFHASVLSKPWVVTTEQQQTLRDEANGTKARAEEKARRRAKKEAKEAQRQRKVEREARRGKEKLKHEMESTRRKDKDQHALHDKHKRRTSDKENQRLDDETNALEAKTLR